MKYKLSFILLLSFISLIALTFLIIQVTKSKPRQEIQVRPVAEFEPSFGIAISEQLLFKQSGPDLVRAITRAGARVYLLKAQNLSDEVDTLLDTRHLFSQSELQNITRLAMEHESFWIRDYLAIPIYRKAPHLPISPAFVDFVYRDGASFDDAAIYQLALSIDLSIEHLPLVIDGGNFMTDGKSCILSHDLTADPEATMPKEEQKRVIDRLPDVLRLSMGCEQTLLVSQEPHPHVDMWIKAVAPQTLLINEITDQALALSSQLEKEEAQKVRNIHKALNDTASHLSKYFTIHRIPMPLPVQERFLTYTNAILVNATAILPHYTEPDRGEESPPDRQLYPLYEASVEKTYRQLGYQTQFVKSDELIGEGGSFHCISYHLPDFEKIGPSGPTPHLSEGSLPTPAL